MTNRVRLSKVKLKTINELEGKFEFVSNDVLKTNCAISLQYILFLLQTYEEYELPSFIRYSILKDIIIHITSIIESLLSNRIATFLENTDIKKSKLMLREVRVRNYKEIYKSPNEDFVIGCFSQEFKQKEFSNHASFNDVINIAYKTNIISKNLKSKLHKARKIRNRIHLASLNEVDDKYDRSDIKELLGLQEEVLAVMQ